MSMQMHVIGFRRTEYPNEAWEVVEIPSTAWVDKYREGFEVDVAQIPEGVTHLRFFCSY